jgi:pilus assembly protein CpaB
MNKAQIAILGVALFAGAAAYMLMPGAPEPVRHIVAAPPPIESDDVLLAGREMQFGTILADADVRWQVWPKALPMQGAVRKSTHPKAIEDVRGAIVRGTFMNGEPIRMDRLVKGPTAGLMSTMIGQGMRAVAINIDASGDRSAGGFIVPNDRVDVLRTFRDEDASKQGQGDVMVTQTILTNVRVLAIGQNIQTTDGKPVVIGGNATLELDPKQAELIVLAQRTGQLSLVLRSLMDAIKPVAAETVAPQNDDKTMTVVRFGIPSQLRSR